MLSQQWQDYFNSPYSRRLLLRQGARLAAALALGAVPGLQHGAARRLTSLPADPFTLGVASGDPTADSVVLWTRLANDVLREMGADQDAIEIAYEISDSESFRNVLRRGVIVAPAELGHSAHAEVRGLQADTVYYYRWQIGDVTSATGRTKTAPAADVDIPQFRFAFASCQQYEHGYYTAYRHMAEEDFDLIVHLGDYIYESSWGDVRVRAHEGPEIRNLADYRARYNTYKSDPDLQAAHASAPWAVTWDDHEVGVGESGGLGVDQRLDLRADTEDEIDPIPRQSPEPCTLIGRARCP